MYKQSIAVIAPDGAHTNFVSNNPQPIALNPTQYNTAGNIALNDFGVIKVGTAANTQGSSFICSVVQEVTSNFHSFDDTSTWAPTTAGLGAASFNAGITTTGATNINHVNGFQTTFNINSSGTTSAIRGINPVLNVANGTVTAFNGIEVTDPIITSGGVVTGTYAFAYNGSGTAGFNWGVYQSLRRRFYCARTLELYERPSRAWCASSKRTNCNLRTYDSAGQNYWLGNGQWVGAGTHHKPS